MVSNESQDLTNITEIKISENKSGKVTLPELYLITKEGLILLSRESIFGNAEALTSFYKKVDLILSLTYDKKPIFSF